jgi:hypothetical protein
LYNEVETWLKDREQSIYITVRSQLNRYNNREYDFLSIKDALVKEALFSPIKLEQINAYSVNDFGTQGDAGFWDYTFRLLGTVGVTLGSIEKFSEASMLQLAVPMAKPFIIMIILIAYVPALIAGSFQWKYIGLFAGVIMSIMFWPFFWELSRLLDDTLLASLDIPFYEVNTQMISQWLVAGMYLYAPLLFTTALGWVGISGVSGTMNSMTSSTGDAGSKGASKAGKAAKAVFNAKK